MRAPRYRFPDEVRSTTRSIAERMVHDANVARTAEELDAWIDGVPEVKDSLERGGYNTRFSSQDLLPLLQVFIVQAGGPAPEVVDERPPPASTRWPVWGFGLVLIVVLIVVLVALVL